MTFRPDRPRFLVYDQPSDRPLYMEYWWELENAGEVIAQSMVHYSRAEDVEDVCVWLGKISMRDESIPIVRVEWED